MEEKNKITVTDLNQTLRQINAQCIIENTECQQVINGLRELEQFLDDFYLLNIGNGYVIGVCDHHTVTFSVMGILSSLELTMGNVIACCECGCIADANTLLRKYRDDLFFYLYILVYNGLDLESAQAKSMIEKIEKWNENELKDFQIGQVLKEIAMVPQLKDIVIKYHLKESFRTMSDALNNYVHSNGRAYYNRKYIDYFPVSSLICELEELLIKARYMTMVFVILLFLCSPVSVMSEDYINYLAYDETPPENSQYWVAPFIEQFVKQHISLIDSNCLEYLRENTEMQI